MQALCEAQLAAGFCVGQIPLANQPQFRSIVPLGASRLLALDRSKESVVFLTDNDGDGVPETSYTIASDDNLNHGLWFDQERKHLYASRDTQVYRWDYDGGFDPATNQIVFIDNMSANGSGGAPQGHTTRSLFLNETNRRLYVSVGSGGNVDSNSFRARIRYLDLDSVDNSNNGLPVDFTTMEIFMDGLRNTVGMAMDKHGVLWGLDVCADRLHRDDLGGAIFQDNPGDELNRFDKPIGTHFGYPYCWTEFKLAETYGLGSGTAWAWPSFMPGMTDEKCRSDEYAASALSLQAHASPLGGDFFRYSSDRPAECDGVPSFPKEMDGYLFIAFHGSWNRDIPVGYKVSYVEMDEEGNVDGEPIDLLFHKGPDAKWTTGFRPVDAKFDVCGRLLVSSDGTSGKGGGLVRIEYTGNEVELNSCYFCPSTTMMPSSSPLLSPANSNAKSPTSPMDICEVACLSSAGRKFESSFSLMMKPPCLGAFVGLVGVLVVTLW